MKLAYREGTALVTGGTGGIGKAVVAVLAEAGLPVGFTYHSRREVAEEMVAAHAGPGPIRTYPLSSSGSRAAEELLRRAAEDLGPVRYLVHCAGIAQESAFFGTAEEDWLRILETNLTSAVALARAAVTPLLKAGFGRIVLLSSVSGQRGIKGHTVYAASKAGLDGFTRSLAQECAPFGVTVNSVAPGFIDTPMLSGVPAVQLEEWRKRIPAGRLGSPEDVANLVAYLMSDQASYVTGQTWLVDGGISL
jgi:3-oxoacyl-[acyl-carrier protein] reductase